MCLDIPLQTFTMTLTRTNKENKVGNLPLLIIVYFMCHDCFFSVRGWSKMSSCTLEKSILLGCFNKGPPIYKIVKDSLTRLKGETTINSMHFIVVVAGINQNQENISKAVYNESSPPSVPCLDLEKFPTSYGLEQILRGLLVMN